MIYCKDKLQSQTITLFLQMDFFVQNIIFFVILTSKIIKLDYNSDQKVYSINWIECTTRSNLNPNFASKYYKFCPFQEFLFPVSTLNSTSISKKKQTIRMLTGFLIFSSNLQSNHKEK